MNLGINWVPFSLESNPTHSPYNPLILIQIQTCHSLKTLQWFSIFRIKMSLLPRTKGFLLFVLYLLCRDICWGSPDTPFCCRPLCSAPHFLCLGLCLLFLQVSFQVPRLFCLSLFSGQMPFCCAYLYLSVIRVADIPFMSVFPLLEAHSDQRWCFYQSVYIHPCTWI